jgi:hypoxanthine phosphoribosyltransferase
VFADVAKILISREQIAERIEQLGRQIKQDYDQLDPDAEIVLVPILTGAVIFVADLMRHLPIKLRMEMVAVSSYPGKAMTSRGAQLMTSMPKDLTGKHILIVDDILDSGSTIRMIRDTLSALNPGSIRACVLLRKQIGSAMQTPCEYVGFDIPDEFVVGYGLDYDNYYRNLPHIGVLKREVL